MAKQRMPSPTYKVTGMAKSANLMPNFTEEQGHRVEEAVAHSFSSV